VWEQGAQLYKFAGVGAVSCRDPLGLRPRHILRVEGGYHVALISHTRIGFFWGGFSLLFYYILIYHCLYILSATCFLLGMTKYDVV